MIVGLSGKKQSGKSTVARYLKAKYKFAEVFWAEPLKEQIGRGLFGLDDAQLYGSDAAKEAIIPKWGMSAREIYQKVGTDCFRDRIHPDFWVILGSDRIHAVSSIGNDVVVTDCRFPNEMDAIKTLGGHSIRVIREGQETKDEHESETALDSYEFDTVLTASSGDLPGLHKLVSEFLNAVAKN